MKNCLAPVMWMAMGAAALLPIKAAAQVPFSSTQSPGLGPFNRGAASSAPLPSSRPASQPAGAYGNNLAGNIPTAPAVAQIDPDHKIGPRDQLSYNVEEDRDDVVHPLTVTDEGDVLLPLGSTRVKAAGKTREQLSADIKSALEREYYKPGHAHVNLALVQIAQGTSKGRVYVTGEVASKGVVDLPVDGQMTVVQAILQLGGFTMESNLKRVFIYRKGGPPNGIQVNAKAVLHGENDKDVVLQPNDTVKVDRKVIGVEF